MEISVAQQKEVNNIKVSTAVTVKWEPHECTQEEVVVLIQILLEEETVG